MLLPPFQRLSTPWRSALSIPTPPSRTPPAFPISPPSVPPRRSASTSAASSVGPSSFSFLSSQLTLAYLLDLAPLTTVGNLPFRRLCVGLGADITCSEMGLAQEFMNGNNNEWSLVRRHPSEKLFGLQICGNKPQVLVPTAEILARSCEIDFLGTPLRLCLLFFWWLGWLADDIRCSLFKTSTAAALSTSSSTRAPDQRFSVPQTSSARRSSA